MSVPDIRSPAFITDPALRALIEEIRDNINTRTPEATSVGDPLDKFVRVRDLIDSGVPYQYGRLGQIGGGGSTTIVVPGGSGGGGTTPDLTPPPTPTGLAVTAGLTYLFIEHDLPSYTQGHGHDRTVVYGAKWPSGDPEPTFSSAVELFQFQGTIGAYPTDLGTRWCIWIKWQSVDGVLSTSPAGGTNGEQATTGQIGSSDLGPAIVLAGNLAPGSVTADKASFEIGGDNLLANNSFELDANANGMADGWAFQGSTETPLASRTPGRISGFAQRVTWTGANSTFKGFRCDSTIGGGVRGGWLASSSYVVSFYARADSAKASGCQLVWGTAPASSTTLKNPNLATAWRRYAFRITMGGSVDANGALAFSCINAAALTGWIEFDDVQVEEGDYLTSFTGKLALNTIVAGDGAIANLAITNALIGNAAIDDAKIANLSAAKLTVGDGTIGGNLKSSNFVAGVSGWRLQPGGSAEFGFASIRGTLLATQIAAGFINSTMIEAGGISADRLVVGSGSQGASISPDPNFQDPGLWEENHGGLPTFNLGGSAVISAASQAQGRGLWLKRMVAVHPGKKYRVSVQIFRNASPTTNGSAYLRLYTGATAAAAKSAFFAAASAVVPPAGAWTTYSAEWTATSEYVTPMVLLGWGGSTGTWFARNLRLEEMIGTVHIEDGAITADKLTTGILIANTAQIADAIITNAKIANLTITGAKVADLTVDTIKIANNAITIPVGGYTAAESVTAGNVTMQSVTFVSTGAPVSLFAGFVHRETSGSPGAGNIELQRTQGAVTTTLLSFLAKIEADGENSVGLPPYTDNPAAGSVTYTLRKTSSGTNYGVSKRGLFAIEVKK